MAAPAIVKLIDPRTGTNRVGLAVKTGDGTIQDLDTWDGKAIEDGSVLRVCSTDWLMVLTIHERIAGYWSLIATVN